MVSLEWFLLWLKNHLKLSRTRPWVITPNTTSHGWLSLIKRNDIIGYYFPHIPLRGVSWDGSKMYLYRLISYFIPKKYEKSKFSIFFYFRIENEHDIFFLFSDGIWFSKPNFKTSWWDIHPKNRNFQKALFFIRFTIKFNLVDLNFQKFLTEKYFRF